MSATSPGAFAAALQEKKARTRRRRLVRWGIGLGSAVVAVFLVWLLAFSPVFRVHDVTVTGSDLLSTEAIIDAAQVPGDSPLLSLDTGGVAERVRELPAVRDVEVGRDLPDTVTIHVTERSLVFQRVAGESLEWVDMDGVVFLTSSEPADGVVQAVTDGTETRLLRDVATVVSHLPESLLPRVERVQAKAVDRITLQLEGGDLVVWGSAEESALKADVLLVLLEVDATLYDVSAPSYPTTK